VTSGARFRAINTHLERQLAGPLDVAAFAEQASLLSPEYRATLRRKVDVAAG
jgi:hypothetical protein